MDVCVDCFADDDGVVYFKNDKGKAKLIECFSVNAHYQALCTQRSEGCKKLCVLGVGGTKRPSVPTPP